MTLYADIGSSRIKFITEEDGFGNEVSLSYDLSTLRDNLSPALEKFSNPERILVANVAGESTADIFQQACIELWSKPPVFLKVKKGYGDIRLAYKDPLQLGIDRWLVMIAAWNLYKTDICIVDCGTAITVDIVNNKGSHLGGYILPGLESMNDILSSKTILKDSTDSTAWSLSPGTSTQECMANGAMLAVKSFIETVINRMNEEQGGNFSCIITGGAAEKIKEHLNIETHYERYLLFTGMKLVAGDLK